MRRRSAACGECRRRRGGAAVAADLADGGPGRDLLQHPTIGASVNWFCPSLRPSGLAGRDIVTGSALGDHLSENVT